MFNFLKRLFTKKTVLKFGTPPVMGFWEGLRSKRPFFVLAPMADVTDCVFRELIAKYSRGNATNLRNSSDSKSCELGNKEPSVFWTEFVSADGLCSPGREALLVDFRYSESERPIVAQLFGSNVENMKKASELVASLGFDGIDINMGCPDRSIEKQGSGACMIKNPSNARAIIRAVKEGAPNLPVSVKTRIGYNSPNLEPWISELLAEGISALTVHARTRKEMSKVPARWEFVKEAVLIRDKMKVPTLIIGNGDVEDRKQGIKRFEETGCDGIMIGRGIFGKPWLFTHSDLEMSVQDRLLIAIEHAELFEKKLGGIKNFNIMKKHFKAYASGFEGAKELRVEIMENAQNASDIRRIIEKFLANN